MKIFSVLMLMILSLSGFSSFANPSATDKKFYRDLTLNIRTEATFKVPMIGNEQQFDYKMEFGAPIYAEPIIQDTPMVRDPKKFYRSYWDRIALNDGSRIYLNGQEIPLTCIFVWGQDNRFSGLEDPRFPQFIMKVYLVANDYTCTGPLNPGFPQNGGKQEAWDTYLYFEIKDPTIMLPVEAKIRYRWNEFNAILVR